MDGMKERLQGYAQELRKEMTKEERHLWYDFLKFQSFSVHRQKVFGRYVVDFYIASARLAIELDGSQHYEEEGLKSDYIRDRYLKSLGIKVLRYTNLDVQQRFAGVCDDILRHVQERQLARSMGTRW